MRRKKERSTSSPRPDGRLTPMDVQQVEFRLSFRGYNERDVDAFLDRITEDLNSYIEENDRLHSASGAPSVDPARDPVGNARREADEILARARQQAAAIVRDAEAGRSVAQGASPVDARAAVAPFLGREREFLQSLGALVQTHAEEIKDMVMALRARAEQQESQAPSAHDPVGGAEEGSSDGRTVALPEAGQEVAGTARTDPAPSSGGDVEAEVGSGPAARLDSGERSLRDLFWGED